MWTFVDLKINKRVDALIKLKNKRVDKKLWICQRTKKQTFGSSALTFVLRIEFEVFHSLQRSFDASV